MSDKQEYQLFVVILPATSNNVSRRRKLREQSALTLTLQEGSDMAFISKNRCGRNHVDVPVHEIPPEVAETFKFITEKEDHEVHSEDE